MACMCVRGASKAVGLAILTFCLGIILGISCPIVVLAIVEMILLTILGYLCLFKW